MITKVERERVFNVMRSLGLALWHEVCTVDLLMQVMLLIMHKVPWVFTLRFVRVLAFCLSLTVVSPLFVQIVLSQCCICACCT